MKIFKIIELLLIIILSCFGTCVTATEKNSSSTTEEIEVFEQRLLTEAERKNSYFHQLCLKVPVHNNQEKFIKIINKLRQTMYNEKRAIGLAHNQYKTDKNITLMLSLLWNRTMEKAN